MGVAGRWFAICALLAGVGVTGGTATADDVPRLPVSELIGLLDGGEVVVIDVRRGGDWEDSAEKVRGAVREDPGDVAAWAGKYPKDKTLVLYCA